MKENVNLEISNLFEEMIVSKIKADIDELKKQIEAIGGEDSELCSTIKSIAKKKEIESLAEKTSGGIKEHINAAIKEQGTGQKFEAISSYLKKQFDFPDNESLCSYLDLLAKNAEKKCKESITQSRQNIVKEIKAGFVAKDDQLGMISQKNEETLRILNNNSALLRETKEESGQIGEQLQQLSTLPDMIRSVEKSVGIVDEENGSSINEMVTAISSAVELLQQSHLDMEAKMNDCVSQIEEQKEAFGKRTKLLTVFSIVSAVGIIVLILLQIIL